MSSNSRIIATDGKSTSGTKHFGLTVKDRQSTTTPNMTQLTIIPASDTVQNHRFILGANAVTPDSGVTPALATSASLTVSPDLTLVSTRFYQFSAYLTIILQTTTSTYYTGHYLLTSATKGTTMMGGGGGYRLDNIQSDNGIDTYLDENAITLNITSNKFVVTITAASNIVTSVDMLLDAQINSGKFT